MSIAALALGLTRAFTFQDNEYTLKPLTYEGCARISLWLEERELIGMQRAIASGADPKMALAAHLENVATARYEPGGQAFQDVLETECGFRKLLELMLEDPPAVEGKTKVDKVHLAFEILADEDKMREAHRLVSELNADPLARRQRKIPKLG